MIGPQNFEYAETPVPEITSGQILVKNLYLSFDPTQRNWMVDRPGYLPPVAMGEVMRAGSVSQVVESQAVGKTMRWLPLVKGPRALINYRRECPQK
jgi:NADPH-dependent curcumin reductase CurA